MYGKNKNNHVFMSVPAKSARSSFDAHVRAHKFTFTPNLVKPIRKMMKFMFSTILRDDIKTDNS